MDLYLFVLSAILMSKGAIGSEGARWNYNSTDSLYGPSHWKVNYPECGESKQSPIHVKTAETKHDINLGPIAFTDYKSSTSHLTTQNSAHGTKVTVETDKPKISGAGFGNTYVLQQFHIHYGNDNTRGSEHLLDNADYGAEVHFVHYRQDLRDDQVLEMPGGIAVLGILLQAGGEHHSGYEKVLSSIDAIGTSNDAIDIAAFPLEDLLPSNVRKYYRYNGSLTTPPCSESVIWTLFQDVVSVSDAQMARFRQVQYDGEILTKNHRPIQSTGARTVYTSWELEQIWEISGAPTCHYMYNITIMLSAMSVIFLRLF